MALAVRCSCGHTYAVGAQARGTLVGCPRCGRAVAVPAANGDRAGAAQVTPPPLPGSRPTSSSSPQVLAERAEALRPGHRKAWNVALGLAFAASGLVIVRITAPALRGGRPVAVEDRAGLPDAKAPPAQEPVTEPEPKPEPGPGPGDAARVVARPAAAEPAAARPVPDLAPVPAVPRNMTTREIVAVTEGSVAHIKGKTGSGSGFLAGPRILVTNHHVIKNESIKSLEVYFPSADAIRRGPYSARLLDRDAARDLAILAVDADLPPLRLARGHVFQKGEDVTIIGSPGIGGQGKVLQNAVSQGILSTETTLDGQRFYQLGAAVNGGNSGGPAFNSLGEVIGVVTAKARAEEAIGFCIPVDDVIQALSRSGRVDVEARARLARQHELSSLAMRLHAVGSAASDVLDAYLVLGSAALSSGATLEDGLNGARRLHAARLGFLDEVMTPALRKEVDTLKTDLAQPWPLRRDLGNLWEVCIAMKDRVQAPRGTLRQLAGEVAGLKARLAGACQALQPALEISFDP